MARGLTQLGEENKAVEAHFKGHSKEEQLPVIIVSFELLH
jgi:hypothetical protein